MLVGGLMCACADASAFLPPDPAADVGPPALDADQRAAFPECRAETFDFEGRGTLRELGLHEATPVPPQDIDTVATIWVTHDLMPREIGEPGGRVEMTRMLCFEFADGTGGSGWPVDPSWRPPGPTGTSDATDAPGIPPTVLAAAVVMLLGVIFTVFAFRRRT